MHVAAAIVLLLFGTRDTLVLLGSTRPLVGTRLIIWTAIFPAGALSACWYLDGIRNSVLFWVAIAAGHLMRFVAASWFDLRPSRNGLFWATAVIPAPWPVLALLGLGSPGGGVVVWCGAVVIAVLALRRSGVEPVLDDVSRYSETLDLTAVAVSGVICSATLARSTEMAVLGALTLGISTGLLFWATRRARWS